jgi:MtN3 and saliva related transmembrane protein
VGSWLTALGLAAGCLTTVAFLPQVVRTWRMRSTGDLSLSTFLILMAGQVLWLAYGILIEDVPLIAANVVSFALEGTVLAFKLRYG